MRVKLREIFRERRDDDQNREVKWRSSHLPCIFTELFSLPSRSFLTHFLPAFLYVFFEFYMLKSRFFLSVFSHLPTLSLTSLHLSSPYFVLSSLHNICATNPFCINFALLFPSLYEPELKFHVNLPSSTTITSTSNLHAINLNPRGAFFCWVGVQN